MFFRSLETLPKHQLSERKSKPKPDLAAAATFQVLSPGATLDHRLDPSKSEEFKPLTTDNYDLSGKMPAKLVLEGEMHCPVGQIKASVDSNLNRFWKQRLLASQGPAWRFPTGSLMRHMWSRSYHAKNFMCEVQ